MSKHSSNTRQWRALAEQVKKEDGGVCQLRYAGCTYDEDLTVDHWMPKSKGGTDERGNLITACRKCNAKKNNKVVDRLYYEWTEWIDAL